MLSGEIRCIADIRARVTESPFWDPRTRQLRFVAIYDGTIHSIDWASMARSALTIRAPVGSIAPTSDGRLVCGLADSVALIDPRSGAIETVARVTHAAPNCRLNDGRCDPAGRFWVGSMIESLDAKVGALYRIDGAGNVLQHVDGLICSNGLAWSPDGTTMYHADSRQKSVWRYDYEPATGDARNRRLFFTTRDGEGRPDGAAVDEEGCYWIARYDGWRIVRHAPDGSEIFTLRTPVQNPTMCAFAGDDLRTLVFTSARGSLDATQLAEQPQAGSVFAVDVAVRGRVEPAYRRARY